MQLRVEQEATQITSDRWRWAVWLDGPPHQIERIQEVTYYLHETFPNPVRTVTDASTKFKLSMSGWGEFTLHITVHCRDGETERLTHRLKLRHRREGLPEEPSDTGIEPLKVFISASLADADMAQLLREALERLGAEVLSLDDVPSSQPWEPWLRSRLDEADPGVALLSRSISPWLESELNQMRRRNTPVIPVVRTVKGEEAISGELAELKGILMDSTSDPDEVARKVLAKGSTQPIRRSPDRA